MKLKILMQTNVEEANINLCDLMSPIQIYIFFNNINFSMLLVLVSHYKFILICYINI